MTMISLIALAAASAAAPPAEAPPPIVTVPQPPPIVRVPMAPPPPPPPPPPPSSFVEPPRPIARDTWIVGDDYPAAALREDLSGITAVRLQVDPAGVPTSCEIVAPSGVPLLDHTACRLLMIRARFTPARDVRGRAVASAYRTRIVWRIPDPPPPVPFEPGHAWLTATLDGVRTRRCEVEASAPIFRPLADQACLEWFADDVDLPASIAGGRSRLRAVVRLAPDGAAAVPPGLERGRLLLRQEARLTVLPLGDVDQCTSVRTFGPAAGVDDLDFDPCDLLAFFAEPGGSAEQAGRLILEIYDPEGGAGG